ncbi:hypothetical protein F4808DRAFT_100299 [Astrocystis sublimbata]|nr:hypothetical protein F4808DRAFT_100299 [Astrocystis sublimbata]
MAGRNFSRYMFDLWSALFAPFNFLFARIWNLPFFTQATERTLGPPRTRSSSFSTTANTPTPTPPPHDLTPDLTPTATDLSSASSVSSPRSQDTCSSHSIADEGRLDHTTTPVLADLDPETLSRDHRQQQSEDMTRRRSNGRGRGGPRAPIQQPVTETTVTHADDAVKLRPAPGEPSATNASGDTSFTPNHPYGPRSTLCERRGNQGRARDSPASQHPSVGGKKENIAPSKDNDTTSLNATAESQARARLTTKNGTGEPQSSGTRSPLPVNAANAANTTSAIGAMCDNNDTSCDRADQLHVVADRLTLADAPPPEQPAQETLDEAATAAKTSALPVPLVVAVPVLSPLRTGQSASETAPAPHLPGLLEPKTDEERAEREYHLKYMREALNMGDLALKTNETPVGCVLVYRGRIIARGMNATNVTRNGTRHAEFMALTALLSRRESNDIIMADNTPDFDDDSWGDVDPKDGHIYPYGQKLHPAPIVNRSIISECVLYVTVEPCVMCASLLRQLGVKKVYFGAVNDKFGGTGGVFRVHMNSKPVPIPQDRPYQQGYGPQDLNLISRGRAVALPREDDEGDGGNVEPGYPVEGGYLRDDAVSLLRRFYVQENGRAPQPRKKEGRAARLYAAMGNQGKPANASDLSDNAPETPVEAESPMELGGKQDPAISIVCT